jgi:hypothetical protein
MPNENNSTNEDRFARQDPQSYSGWSSLITVAILAVVIGIVVFFYVVR